jgi:hypothetical protein
MSQKQTNPEPLATASGLGNVNSRAAVDFRAYSILETLIQFFGLVHWHRLTACQGATVADLICGEARR